MAGVSTTAAGPATARVFLSLRTGCLVSHSTARFVLRMVAQMLQSTVLYET